MKSVRKRDGKLESFDQERITSAIWKAAKAVGGKDRELAKMLSGQHFSHLHSGPLGPSEFIILTTIEILR